MPKYLSLMLAFAIGMVLGMWVVWYPMRHDTRLVAQAERKPLFYRHPMGAADTSPTPKKDEMGMDYLPVYEDELSASRLVNIVPAKIQKLGVRTEKIEKRKLVRSLRVPGSIQVDERRTYAVASKYEGWVQRLYLNATGIAVRRGQPLLDVYSPDLLAAQQEYLNARQRLDTRKKRTEHARIASERVVADALRLLRHLDIGPDQLQQLEAPNAVPFNEMPLLSPVDGVVLEKKAVEGLRFWRGDVLFRIAELSKVWFVADVFEQDLGWIRPGQGVSLQINAYPGREFRGRIEFISPIVEPETRTIKINVEMPNDGGFLKLGMYGSADLTAAAPSESLALPESAVIDSGTRQVVLIRKGEGVFEPRNVKLGQRAGGYFEVQEGVAAGETVVTHANFLIDAESNLKAALDGMSVAGERDKTAPASRAENATSENRSERR
ncbi:efflux RND transporter periplasmic adaptor subunit [Methylocaldum gracile subsp. desertum]|uniref:efflux RND transporter periplasmic adaptor subunit n=1 Tax=Methylocaldum sp. GT1BW TaxID=3438964 RepID=UPI003DA0CCFD